MLHCIKPIATHRCCLLQRCGRLLVLVTVRVYRLLVYSREVVMRPQCTLASLSFKYRLHDEPLELRAPVDRVLWSRETVYTSHAQAQNEKRAVYKRTTFRQTKDSILLYFKCYVPALATMAHFNKSRIRSLECTPLRNSRGSLKSKST